MENTRKLIIILICIALAFTVGGFYICATSLDNVFIGVFVIIFGSIIALSAIIPAAKLIQQQDKQKEDRIKRLEKEVELLKKHNHNE